MEQNKPKGAYGYFIKTLKDQSKMCQLGVDCREREGEREGEITCLSEAGWKGECMMGDESLFLHVRNSCLVTSW